MINRRSLVVGAAGVFASSAVKAQQRAWIGGSIPYPGLNQTYDVVVYGGTLGGINAAFTAALNGARVALVEPTGHVGGMTGAGGLGQIDIASAQRSLIGGIFWQQLQRIALLEGIAGCACQTLPTTAAASITSTDQGYFPAALLNVQPKNCAKVLRQYSYAPGIDLYINAPLVTFGGSVYPAVTMNGLSIAAIQTAVGVINGRCFIDASYEGDVLAGAAYYSAASYTFGREASAQYGESLAGVQKQSPNGYGPSVNYTDGGGVPIFPFIANTADANGAADARIQHYTVRATLQKIANGGVAFVAPSGYNESDFLIIGQIASAASYTTLSQVCGLTALTGNEYCFNNPLVEYTNQDNGYPDGTPSQRAPIIAGHNYWIKGFLYYCANGSTAPAALRADTATYGLAGSEFTDNGNWPYQVYVREGRRMVGMQVMKQADIQLNVTQTHPICKASYVLDNHPSANYAATQHTQINDNIPGDNTCTGFQIPMEAIIPQVGQCPNLIVPVCASVSHVAWQGMRYEAQFAMMGEAAGIMAAKAVSLSKSVQSLNYATDVLPGLTAINAKLS